MAGGILVSDEDIEDFRKNFKKNKKKALEILIQKIFLVQTILPEMKLSEIQKEVVKQVEQIIKKTQQKKLSEIIAKDGFGLGRSSNLDYELVLDDNIVENTIGPILTTIFKELEPSYNITGNDLQNHRVFKALDSLTGQDVDASTIFQALPAKPGKSEGFSIEKQKRSNKFFSFITSADKEFTLKDSKGEEVATLKTHSPSAVGRLIRYFTGDRFVAPVSVVVKPVTNNLPDNGLRVAAKIAASFPGSVCREIAVPAIQTRMAALRKEEEARILLLDTFNKLHLPGNKSIKEVFSAHKKKTQKDSQSATSDDYNRNNYFFNPSYSKKYMDTKLNEDMLKELAKNNAVRKEQLQSSTSTDKLADFEKKLKELFLNKDDTEVKAIIEYCKNNSNQDSFFNFFETIVRHRVIFETEGELAIDQHMPGEPALAHPSRLTEFSVQGNDLYYREHFWPEQLKRSVVEGGEPKSVRAGKEPPIHFCLTSKISASGANVEHNVESLEVVVNMAPENEEYLQKFFSISGMEEFIAYVIPPEDQKKLRKIVAKGSEYKVPAESSLNTKTAGTKSTVEPKEPAVAEALAKSHEYLRTIAIELKELASGDDKVPSPTSHGAIIPGLKKIESTLPQKKVEFLPVAKSEDRGINARINQSLQADAAGIHVFTFSANTAEAQAIRELNKCLDQYCNGTTITLNVDQKQEIVNKINTAITAVKPGGGQAIPFLQHFENMKKELKKITPNQETNISFLRTRVVGMPTISYTTEGGLIKGTKTIANNPRDEEIQESFNELQKYAKMGASVHVFCAEQESPAGVKIPLIGGGLAEKVLSGNEAEPNGRGNYEGTEAKGKTHIQQTTIIHKLLTDFVKNKTLNQTFVEAKDELSARTKNKI